MKLCGRDYEDDDRSYEVMMSMADYEAQEVKLLDWLIDNFGVDEDTGLWDQWEWAAKETVYFSFRFECDAMAFKLAWT